MANRRSPLRVVNSTGARARFGDLLDRVERGEVVLISRRGKPVARLGPCSEVIDRDRARAAARRLLVFSDAEGLRLPKGVKLKDLLRWRRR
jgi:prevent-host-death family protein